MIKVLGRKPSGERLKRIAASPQFREGVFHNLEPTDVILKNVSYMKMMRDYFRKPSTVNPAGALPVVKTDLKNLSHGKPTVVWFGHSSYLISSNGFNILVDPVFSKSAGPFSFMMKSFRQEHEYAVDDLPPVDLLLITHDHYDHLNYETILSLGGRVKKIITPLGAGEHLEYWGIKNALVTEMDWWDQVTVAEGVELTATPARHFTGRGIVRNQSLWSSFALKLHGYKIFVGGDSGYDNQFKRIGEKFGGFDLAILECGQYGAEWPLIHMFPEEVVQAAMDLKADVLLPVHWAKFPLSYHPWNEPVKRLLAAANERPVKITVPEIGKAYCIGDPVLTEPWWDQF